jgi:hypothetical protein
VGEQTPDASTRAATDDVTPGDQQGERSTDDRALRDERDTGDADPRDEGDAGSDNARRGD